MLNPIILTVLIPILLTVLAVARYRLHHRADRRAELKERREHPRLTLYLHNAATELVDDATHRIWRFALLVTNHSDRENSVTHAECRISYRTTGEDIHTVAIPAHASHGDSGRSTGELTVPLQLDGREARKGVLSFRAPNSALAGHDIIGYTIALEDAHGKEYLAEPIVVMETGSESGQASREAEDQDD